MASQVSCFLSQPARCRAFIHLSTSSDRWGFAFKHHISCWITDHADEARFLDAKFQLQVDPALFGTFKPQLLQKAVIYHLLHIEGRGLPQDGCIRYMDMVARYHCATKKFTFFCQDAGKIWLQSLWPNCQHRFPMELAGWTIFSQTPASCWEWPCLGDCCFQSLSAP